MYYRIKINKTLIVGANIGWSMQLFSCFNILNQTSYFRGSLESIAKLFPYTSSSLESALLKSFD